MSLIYRILSAITILFYLEQKSSQQGLLRRLVIVIILGVWPSTWNKLMWRLRFESNMSCGTPIVVGCCTQASEWLQRGSLPMISPISRPASDYIWLCLSRSYDYTWSLLPLFCYWCLWTSFRETDSGASKLSWEMWHRPVAVSMASNLPSYKKAKCFMDSSLNYILASIISFITFKP